MCRLAFALAEKGKSILIIDYDSSDKNILNILGKDFELDGVKLIPADKLHTTNLKDPISSSSIKYDYAFINTASGIISSRILDLATQADFILTVVNLGQTSMSTLTEHKINLSKANSQMYVLTSKKRN